MNPPGGCAIDDLAAIVLRNSPGPNTTTASEVVKGGHSGRWFVLAAGMTVLVIWGTLYLVFRDWRAKYRERALYGATKSFRQSTRCGHFCRPGSTPPRGVTQLTKRAHHAPHGDRFQLT